jgi:8-oxo-dGTP pyrophosphatase MutT (NUDIX family)
MFSGVSTVPIRPAATVLVLRDAPNGPEVFMVRRHHAIAFMAGAHVFPGGRVDAADHAAADDWCDGVALAGSSLAGVGADDALAFHVAAARELFEEAGVLLATTAQREFVSLAAPADHARFKQHRADVHDGRRSLREVIVGEQLRLALDAIVPFAHWVTPPTDVRRFDTRFFITRVPSDQAPVHDETESTHSCWLTPSDALSAAIAGDIVLPPPTWASLRELEPFADVDSALGWARSRTIHRREPLLLEDGARRSLVLPGDPMNPEEGQTCFETRFHLIDGRWRAESRT